MSWITDHKENEGTEEETICRVYGHRLSAAATAALSSDEASVTTGHLWMTMDELEVVASATSTGQGGQEANPVLLALSWVRMWMLQQDEHGDFVRRGFGVATGDAGTFISWVGGRIKPLFSSCLLAWRPIFCVVHALVVCCIRILL